ncbi:MAG: ATP-dependent DNA helicase [Pseudomonadota bacterium]
MSLFAIDCPLLPIYSLLMPDPIHDPIEEILGRNGRLARTLEGFEYRPTQIQMARLIQRALEKKQPSLIEAGTGTGKTLGYLLPLLLSKKKSVISTGTKNLQEQIYFKDIPLLAKATGRKTDALLMKGRKNYLCLHRFHQFFSKPSLFSSVGDDLHGKFLAWMDRTTFADRAELEWMGDDDPLWDAISSTSEQCLGGQCLHWEDCYLNALRREAARCGLIIVNHHLFFADLMVKKGGFGEILPRFQTLVFDEAHKIEEIATSYFGESLSTRQILELANDADKETGEFKGPEKNRLKRHIDFLKTGAELLLNLLERSGERGQVDLDTIHRIESGPGRMLQKGLRYLHEKISVETSKASLQSVSNRAGALVRSLENILSSKDHLWLKWFEKRKQSLVIHASPLDISQDMEAHLYHHVKRIVFTSATLSTDGNFDYFRSRLGIFDPVIQGIFPSHFHFKEQSLLYVPKDLPLPNHPAFPTKIAERILEILNISSGRALILFTSYANLNLVHQWLEGKIPYRICRQGVRPRSLLLEEFRKDIHSVLLATGSFWQGVDVPGEALSCLIIDKLPFDSPGDPLVAGRIDAVRERGGNPFMEYQLPSAIIALKQGLGRLIRSSTDRGILSILDRRLIDSRYGRLFFHSLPDIPVTNDLEEIRRFFSG